MFFCHHADLDVRERARPIPSSCRLAVGMEPVEFALVRETGEKLGPSASAALLEHFRDRLQAAPALSPALQYKIQKLARARGFSVRGLPSAK